MQNSGAPPIDPGPRAAAIALTLATGFAAGFAVSVAGAMLILIGYRVLRRLDRRT